MDKSVRLDLKRLINSTSSRRMIDRELSEWPLGDDDRRDLIEFAITAVKVLIRLMPPQHNVLVIPFKVLVVCKRRVNENDLVVELMEEDDYGMVPATDSSIKTLKIKTVTLRENEDESCSICLEDFYTGCEVLSMPCSHIFHEDCIKKWLKTSHYCPICRLEMPTS
ncbi:E3 ubiquitin-protein ligase RING1-like [Primulina eburnea]|uniref:E3 ubiquitin-protein ligase RING1-like n=1 Tax=Primulina eburnea TaxID=1245227 RepID=UPI003C6C8BD5